MVLGALSGCGVGQESLEILSGTVILGLTGVLDLGNAVSPIFHPKTFPKLPISLSSKTPHPLPPLLFCPMPKMKNRLGNFFHPNRFPKLRNVSLCVSAIYFFFLFLSVYVLSYALNRSSISSALGSSLGGSMMMQKSRKKKFQNHRNRIDRIQQMMRMMIMLFISHFPKAATALRHHCSSSRVRDLSMTAPAMPCMHPL